MLLYIDYPSWLKPEIFSFLNIGPSNPLYNLKWYSFMYIVALFLSYVQANVMIKLENYKMTKKSIEEIYFWAIVGMILGARIFFCIIYDFGYYIHHPLEILIPIRDGVFIGFQGLSYHGGAIGIFLGILISSRSLKINFRDLCDVIFPSIPLGYTFGRIGNFINGELYGRVTASPIAVLFPNAEKLPLTLPDVTNVISKLGWNVDVAANTVTNSAGEVINNVLGKIALNGNIVTAINLPRHPSQLYEALFEGIFIFLLMWFVLRKFKPFKGVRAPIYLASYGVVRFILEFFRQPDMQFADVSANKFTGYIVGHISMGQILCLIMILVAVISYIYLYYLDKKEKASLVKKK